MSKRLLLALEYPNADNVNLDDENTFKSIIIWLETNKIRKAPNDVVNQLKNNNRDWHNTFSKYKDGIGCPPLKNRTEELQWILGYAVQLETQKNMSIRCYQLTGTPFPIQDADLGFDLNDPVLNQAAKILRMIYIQDMRNLQTRANELIVAVQSVTANPKTDTKLGKVGF
uniref:RNA transcription, translation and transport factor protein n=1 Tax=Diabrotica virgifera virgifera TaxID=50390 RepID=A0A6P7FWR2_DIAVI